MSFGVVAFVVSVASIVYSYVEAKKAKARAEKEADKAKGILVPSDTPSGAIPIVYGKARISGYRVFVKTKSSFSRPEVIIEDKVLESGLSEPAEGEKNEYLYLQQALCSGPINSIERFLINEIPVSPGEYGSLENDEDAKKLANRFILTASTSGSEASSLISSNFIDRQTAVFTDTAYVSGVFKLNRDDPQYNGVPDVSCLVKGKLIQDINPDYTLNTARFYSNNSALVLLDYLLDYANIPVESINLESFYKAKVICDKTVDTNRLFGGEIESPARYFIASGSVGEQQITLNKTPTGVIVGMYVFGEEISPETKVTGISGNTITLSKPTGNEFSNKSVRFSGTVADIKLYTFNGVLQSDEKFRDNIQKIMDSMSQASLIWSDGKYKLVLYYPENISEVDNLSVLTVTDSELVADTVEIRWPDIEDKLNKCEVKFSNEVLDFAEDTVFWPVKG